eukprot:238375-Rhodomonas_salina.2
MHLHHLFSWHQARSEDECVCALPTPSSWLSDSVKCAAAHNRPFSAEELDDFSGTRSTVWNGAGGADAWPIIECGCCGRLSADQPKLERSAQASVSVRLLCLGACADPVQRATPAGGQHRH